ncbi:MAG: 50S ribosomal protein L19 [Candidatus Firestonebacteria bacterium]|nr:50S ribosomal protein L19 [Candidatus Firestonebacteria bacterium]
MNEQVVKSIQAEYLKKKVVDFNPGDTIIVYVKIFEGDKARIQAFEGIVIRMKRSGLDELFTVRRVSFGVGIERTFFIHSPVIDKIKIVRRGKVKRAKLYYLRNKSGKDARITEDAKITSKEETQEKEIKAS